MEETTWVSDKKEYSEEYLKSNDNGVLIEFKPEAIDKSTIESGQENDKTGVRLGKKLNINDVQKVTDNKGNVLYDASKEKQKIKETKLSVPDVYQGQQKNISGPTKNLLDTYIRYNILSEWINNILDTPALKDLVKNNPGKNKDYKELALAFRGKSDIIKNIPDEIKILAGEFFAPTRDAEQELGATSHYEELKNWEISSKNPTNYPRTGTILDFEDAFDLKEYNPFVEENEKEGNELEALGITKKSVKKHVKKYVTNLSKNVSKEKQKTKETKYNKAQVFVPSRFRNSIGEIIDLFEGTGNDRKYIYRENSKSNWKLKKGMIDDELLNLTGFRIPTSSHVSATEVEIAGFLPPENGDLMIVPSEFSPQKGLDYDVDKEFTYQLNHYATEDGITTIDKHFGDIDIQDALKNMRKKLRDYKKIYKHDGHKYNRMLEDQHEEFMNNMNNNSYQNLLTDIFRNIIDYDKEIKKLNSYSANKYSKLSEYDKLIKLHGNINNADIEKLQHDIRIIKDLEKRKLENKLIRIHKAVLSSDNPDIQRKINKVLSMKFASDMADTLQDDDDEFTTILSDSYQRNKMNLGAVGQMGIGVYSNYVVLNSLLQQTEESIFLNAVTPNGTSPLNIRIGKYTSDGRLGRYINIIPELEVERILKYYVGDKDEFREKLLAGAVQYNAIKEVLKNATPEDKKILDKIRPISEAFAEKQNTATDNEKEQIMGRVGVNGGTINVDSLLTLLGFDKAERIKDINGKITNETSLSYLIISQPIVKEYIKAKQANKSITNAKYNSTEKIIETLKKQYGGKKGKDEYLTPQELYNNIKKKPNNFTQVAVLELFIKLESAGKNINDLQRVVGINKDGLGKDFVNTIDLKNNLKKLHNTSGFSNNVVDLLGKFEANTKENENLIDEGYIPIDDVLIKPTTMMGHIVVNAISTGYNLWNSFFPYENSEISLTFDKILQLSNIKSATDISDLKKDMIAELKKFINSAQGLGTIQGDPLIERKRLFTDKDGPSLAAYLLLLKQLDNEIIINNPLLNKLKMMIGNVDENEISKILFDNTSEHAFDEEQMYHAFADLLLSDEALPDNKSIKLNTEQVHIASINNEHVQTLIEDGTKTTTVLSTNKGMEVGEERHIVLNNGNRVRITYLGEHDINHYNSTFGDFTTDNGMATELSDDNTKEFVEGKEKHVFKYTPVYSTRNLAQDLISYSFLSGEQQGAIDFARYIPLDYLELIGHTGFMNSINLDSDDLLSNIMKNNASGFGNFVIQYFQHNPDKLHKIPKLKLPSAVKGINSNHTAIQLEFAENEYLPEMISILDSNTYKLMPYILVDGVYIKLPSVGTFGMKEYDINKSNVNSIISNVEVDPITVRDFNKTIDKTVQDPFNIRSNDMNTVLTGISERNDNYGELAKMFNDIGVDTELLLEVKDINDYGYFNDSTNTITLSTVLIDNADSNTQARIILHEYLHSLTTKRINKYFDNYNNIKAGYTYDELPSDIKKLVTLFDIVKKEYDTENNITQEVYDSMIEKRKNNGVLNEIESKAYKFLNYKEFITAAMTDPELVEFMKNTNIDNVSSFDKFINFIMEMINTLVGKNKDLYSITRSVIIDVIENNRKETENNIKLETEITTATNKETVTSNPTIGVKPVYQKSLNNDEIFGKTVNDVTPVYPGTIIYNGFVFDTQELLNYAHKEFKDTNNDLYTDAFDNSFNAEEYKYIEKMDKEMHRNLNAVAKEMIKNNEAFFPTLQDAALKILNSNVKLVNNKKQSVYIDEGFQKDGFTYYMKNKYKDLQKSIDLINDTINKIPKEFMTLIGEYGYDYYEDFLDDGLINNLKNAINETWIVDKDVLKEQLDIVNRNEKLINSLNLSAIFDAYEKILDELNYLFDLDEQYNDIYSLNGIKELNDMILNAFYTKVDNNQLNLFDDNQLNLFDDNLDKAMRVESEVTQNISVKPVNSDIIMKKLISLGIVNKNRTEGKRVLPRPWQGSDLLEHHYRNKTKPETQISIDKIKKLNDEYKRGYNLSGDIIKLKEYGRTYEVIIDEKIVDELNNARQSVSRYFKKPKEEGDDIEKRIINSNSEFSSIMEQISKFDIKPYTVELVSPKEVTNRLKKLGFNDVRRNGKRIIGIAFYQSSSHTIVVSGQIIDKSLVHEIIHAYTVGMLNDKNSDFYKDMTAIYEQALKYEDSLPDEYMYGLTNVKEFVAEVMSNSEFARQMAKLPSITKVESLYEDFKILLKNLFKINQIDYSLFDQAIDTITMALHDQTENIRAEKAEYEAYNNAMNDEYEIMEYYKNMEIISNFTKNNQEALNKLKEKYPEIKLKYTQDVGVEFEVGDDKVIFNQELANKVDYSLKIVDVLNNLSKPKITKRSKKYNTKTIPERSTIRLNTKQQPNIEVNVRKNLKNKGVSDKQIDYIFDYMSSHNLTEISTEELAIGIAAENSFAVEVNVAMEKLDAYDMVDTTGEGNFEPFEFIPDTELEEVEDEYGNTIGIREVISEKGKQQIRDRENRRKPLQTYNDLTRPGGINYTNNEIKTPGIVPNRKGHADFATDEGIGWFRSDEEFFYSTDREILSKLEKDFKHNIISDSEYESKLRQLENNREEQLIIETTKTRRVLKIQSDLFQKERESTDLVTKNEPSTETKENDFLQLLNKEGNWVTFFIESIIQDSIKKGYNEILFPTGETAAKIEGHEVIADKIRNIDNDIEFWKNAKPTINEVYKKHGEEMWTITYNDIIKGNFNTKEEAQKHIDNIDFNKLEQQKQELEANGLEKFAPIEGFYENRVTNILNKKYKGKIEKYTDEHGAVWNKLKLSEEYKNSIILNQVKQGKIAGQANIEAATALIDASIAGTDTLYHEYAHHYIAWNRDSALVQEAIKKWGSEEALVQAIGEQSAKQKGEAWNWWLRFTAWLLGDLNDLSKFDKETLKNVLTDAFLERQNLNGIEYRNSDVVAAISSINTIFENINGDKFKCKK